MGGHRGPCRSRPSRRPCADSVISERSAVLGSTRTRLRSNSARSSRPAVSLSTTRRAPCREILSPSAAWRPNLAKPTAKTMMANAAKAMAHGAPASQKIKAVAKGTAHNHNRGRATGPLRYNCQSMRWPDTVAKRKIRLVNANALQTATTPVQCAKAPHSHLARIVARLVLDH